jgi:hypothetical protein
MRRVAAAILLLAAMAAAPPAPDGEAPEYYGCAFIRDVGGARLAVRATVDLDGHPIDFSATLWGSERRLRLWRQISWGGPTFQTMADNARIILQYFQRRQFTGRIELWRVEGAGAAAVAASEARWSNMHDLTLLWREIDAATRAPGGLVARVTGADGRPIMEGRLDAAAYDGAMAALREGRARLEAMIADFRTRCEPERSVEVIST